ncbi:MAG TPA: substrate-binding domain-containing protein [Acidimicrobiia bacterium]|nr:substrate-binding domain-containing protein [Acidimicrobiia bacterium]
MKSRLTRLAALLAVMALVLAACGGDGGDDPTTTENMEETPTTEEMTDDGDDGGGELSELGLPIVDPLDVDTSVDVGIAGSSTVFPLSTAVLTQWIDEGGPQYTIDSIGSGGGLERFCVEGASDIANASRQINDEEFADCTGTWGTEPIEVRVGSDALSLVISPGNYFAQELTIDEIATAYASTDANATWADVNPDFPAHPIQTFTPGADSGTFDYFFEIIYADLYDADEAPPILSSIAEIVGEDDNLTVQGVSQDGCTEGDLSSTCAIGYFGYAYYQQNADVLETVAVEGVAPSAESVNANTYAISRPLYMYTSDAVIQAKPQVAEFMAYYLNNVNAVIGDVGYFPAPQEALQEAADNIKAAAGW